MSSINSQEPSRDSSLTTLLLPWITGLAASNPREISIQLYQHTRPVSSIEGDVNLNAIILQATSVGGPQPASKASIESLPRVQVSDPGEECPICLVEYEVNSEVNQMPCRHMFHSDCLGKWLGIHGSCPVCRFSMPVEGDKKEGEMGSIRWIIHVFVSESGRASDVESESGNGDNRSQAQDMEELDS